MPTALAPATNRLFASFTALLVVLCSFLIASPGSSRADDWMFRRSYYSHVPQPDEVKYPPPMRRSAYRRAYVGTEPGFAVRGGWRYNTMVLYSGSSTDVTFFREGWFEVRP